MLYQIALGLGFDFDDYAENHGTKYKVINDELADKPLDEIWNTISTDYTGKSFISDLSQIQNDTSTVITDDIRNYALKISPGSQTTDEAKVFKEMHIKTPKLSQYVNGAMPFPKYRVTN